MTEPSPPHDEALKRFDERLDALRSSSRRPRRHYGSEDGASAGYRLLGELVGGILTGLGLGWLFDRFAGTAPLGLIVGVLLGTAAAVWMAVRSATRASARPPAHEDDGSGDGA